MGHAVRSMIEFIFEVASTDPELSTLTSRRGDLLLVQKAAALIREKYPNQARLLDDLCLTSVLYTAPTPPSWDNLERHRSTHFGPHSNERGFWYCVSA